MKAALAKVGKKPPCYAAQVHENRLAHSFPHNYAKSFGEVRLIPGRLRQCESWSDLTGKMRADKPWLGTTHRIIFLSDMADALSDAVPFEYLLAEVIVPLQSEKMIARRHQFLWLTKRPQRMLEFFLWLGERGIDWPTNLWAGTSVTNRRTADLRLKPLMAIKARRFLSIEPLREQIRIPWIMPGGYDFVIVGGESGVDATPFDLDWARLLISQCAQVSTLFFMKQVGRRPVEVRGGEVVKLALKDGHGGDWNEWPADLRVREFPS